MASEMLLMLLVLFWGLSFGDRIVSPYSTQENTSHSKFRLKIFTTELLKLDINESNGISDQCRYDFNLYKEAILNHTIGTNDRTSRAFIDNSWAYKMLDATGKLPDGILQGNLYALGSYSSCLDIEAKPEGSLPFSGKFGGAQFIDLSSNDATAMVAMPMLLYGVCLPSSCTDRDFKSILHAVDYAIHNKFRIIWIPHFSVAHETYKLEGGDIIMILFLAFLGGLLVAATMFESWILFNKQQKPHERWKQLLLGFSIYTNTQKLFKITRPSNTPGSSEHLSCLDGMRFISMTWVLLGHTLPAVGQNMPSMNFLPWEMSDFNRVLFQCVANGFVSVDTFFFMSGTLLAYLTFKELDKRRGRLNIPLFYIHRYLRLTGVYAFVLCLHYTLYGAFKTAPQLKSQYPGMSIESTKDMCQKVWWKNLLYVGIYSFDKFGLDQNKYPPLACLGQAWYLDCDMQMFLIILVVIIPLWKWGRCPPYAGIIEAGFFAMASIAVPFGLHVYYKWPATAYLPVPEGGDPDYFFSNYLMPWCRFSPYIGGVIMGYILYRTKDKEVKIPRKLNLLLWSVAIAIGLSVVYGLNLPIRMPGEGTVVTLDQIGDETKDLSLAASAVYGGFHRFAWSVAIGWLVFACCRGYGGWINEFLSWEAFQPLSKLTYIIYLVHLSINQILHSYVTFIMTSSNFIGVIYSCATLVYSIAVAIVIYIGFELPWLSTEKLIVSWLVGGGPNPKKAQE